MFGWFGRDNSGKKPAQTDETSQEPNDDSPTYGERVTVKHTFISLVQPKAEKLDMPATAPVREKPCFDAQDDPKAGVKESLRFVATGESTDSTRSDLEFTATNDSTVSKTSDGSHHTAPSGKRLEPTEPSTVDINVLSSTYDMKEEPAIVDEDEAKDKDCVVSTLAEEPTTVTADNIPGVGMGSFAGQMPIPPPMYPPMLPPMYPPMAYPGMMLPQWQPNPLNVIQKDFANYDPSNQPQGWDSPAFGTGHYFHPETEKTGVVDNLGIFPGMRRVIKGAEFKSRLSVVTEASTKTGGQHKYLVQLSGNLSTADGIGFVFSNKLPCPKNIQKINSLFLNKNGRVKCRVGPKLIDCQIQVCKPDEMEDGDWIEMYIDLDNKQAMFTIWPMDSYYWNPMWGQWRFRTSPIYYGEMFEKSEEKVSLRTGHLAVVLKEEHGIATIGS